MFFEITVKEPIKMLQNLSTCLDKAAAHAAAKKFDASVLLAQRLAPDQFALARQVQIACDNAKNGNARLAGKEPPKHEDNETTIPELKARIEKVVAYLQTFKESDFAGASERKISLPYWGGKSMTGADYAREYFVPNFYFHVVTAYSILRHNGVDVGKSEYLGHLTMS